MAHWISRSLDNPKHRRSFRKWLAANGATVLDPTNEYEVIRFRGSAGISVVYKGKRGYSFTGQAQDAWRVFSDGSEMDLSAPPPAYINDPGTRPPAMSDADLLTHAASEPVTIAFLMGRDQMPMRAAAARLFGLERAGHLARSGGEPGRAFFWRAA